MPNESEKPNGLRTWFARQEERSPWRGFAARFSVGIAILVVGAALIPVNHAAAGVVLVVALIVIPLAFRG